MGNRDLSRAILLSGLPRHGEFGRSFFETGKTLGINLKPLQNIFTRGIYVQLRDFL